MGRGFSMAKPRVRWCALSEETRVVGPPSKEPNCFKAMSLWRRRSTREGSRFSLWRVLCFVTVLHLGVMSFVFGPWRLGYVLVGYFSAVLVWGLVFLLGDRWRRAGCIVGILAVAVTQQLACRMMGRGSPGGFWPLAQFFTLHYLVAVAIKRVFDSGRRISAHDKGVQPSAGRLH